MDGIIIGCAHWRGRVCVARDDVAPELRFQRRVDGLLTRVKPSGNEKACRSQGATWQNDRICFQSHQSPRAAQNFNLDGKRIHDRGVFARLRVQRSTLFYFPMAPCQEGERAERLTNTLPGAKHGGRHRQQCTSASMSLRV